MNTLNLNFYYGKQADQFTFYRLPKALIMDARYKGLSDSAKLLYGLMLDRMALSARNGWLDEENRVYIKYSFANIMTDMNCAREKASRLLKELEDIGLIWRLIRTGRASIIYVKNFVSAGEEKPADQFDKKTGYESDSIEDAETNAEDDSAEIEPVRNEDQFDNSTCDGKKNEQGVVRKSNANYININKTNINNNNHIYHDEIDGVTYDVDNTIAYMELIKNNIDYDIHMSDETWWDKELYDELYQLICEVVCVPRKTIRISGQDFPYNLVKSQFLKLNSEHLKYVISCLERNTKKISNIKSYMLTALYNAPSTIKSFYNAEVNYDMGNQN